MVTLYQIVFKNKKKKSVNFKYIFRTFKEASDVANWYLNKPNTRYIDYTISQLRITTSKYIML